MEIPQQQWVNLILNEKVPFDNSSGQGIVVLMNRLPEIAVVRIHTYTNDDIVWSIQSNMSWMFKFFPASLYNDANSCVNITLVKGAVEALWFKYE